MKVIHNFLIACLCAPISLLAAEALHQDNAFAPNAPVTHHVDRCGCHKPKPQPQPKPESMQIPASESTSSPEHERCGCNRPRPRSEQIEKEQCVDCTPEDRCPCNKPRPRSRAPRRTTLNPELLTGVLELLQEESIEGLEALTDIIRSLRDALVEEAQAQEAEVASACTELCCGDLSCDGAAAHMRSACTCDTTSILEKLEEYTENQNDNFQKVFKLLEAMSNILEVCSGNIG